MRGRTERVEVRNKGEIRERCRKGEKKGFKYYYSVKPLTECQCLTTNKESVSTTFIEDTNKESGSALLYWIQDQR